MRFPLHGEPIQGITADMQAANPPLGIISAAAAQYNSSRSADNCHIITVAAWEPAHPLSPKLTPTKTMTRNGRILKRSFAAAIWAKNSFWTAESAAVGVLQTVPVSQSLHLSL